MQPKELPLTVALGFRGLVDLLAMKQSASLAWKKGRVTGKMAIYHSESVGGYRRIILMTRGSHPWALFNL